MGFYTTMLRENEEFMGNVGFDDDLIGQSGGKYAADLNDVADIVKDINVDYADQSSQEELDAQDLAEDPVEECALALAESEYNWNLIWKAVGTKELNEAATGKAGVMTEGAVGDFFKKVKEFFVKLFKKITAFFKNWLDNALAIFRTNDSFVKKYGSQLEKGKAAFEDGNKSIKGYTFSKGNLKAAGDDILKAINKRISSEKARVNDIRGNLDNKNLELRIKADTGDNDKLRGMLCGKDSVSSSDFRDSLKTAYFGSEDKEELDPKKDEVMKADYIRTTLQNGKKNIETAKKTYGEIKKAFDSAVKTCDAIERNINNAKGKDSESQNKQLSAAQALTKYMKDSRSDVSTAFSMYLKAMKAQISQARKVGNAYIVALNGKTRKDKVEKLSDSTFFGGIQMI